MRLLLLIVGLGGYSVPATGWKYIASEGVLGGNGGFAGIHVPQYDTKTTIKYVQVDETTNDIKRNEDGTAVFLERTYDAGYATLNLSGSGTLKAYGGDASDGGNGGRNNLDWGAGRGWWCRRWNWW